MKDERNKTLEDGKVEADATETNAVRTDVSESNGKPVEKSRNPESEATVETDAETVEISEAPEETETEEAESATETTTEAPVEVETRVEETTPANRTEDVEPKPKETEEKDESKPEETDESKPEETESEEPSEDDASDGDSNPKKPEDEPATETCESEIRKRPNATRISSIVVLILLGAVIVGAFSWAIWKDAFDVKYSLTITKDGVVDGFTYKDYKNAPYEFRMKDGILFGRLESDADEKERPVVFEDDFVEATVRIQMKDGDVAEALADVHAVEGGIAGIHEETVTGVKKLKVTSNELERAELETDERIRSYVPKTSGK